jgi:hypothetical protein
MLETVKGVFAGRSVWMNLLMVFCAYMTFIYMPFDFFYKPVADDEEVWFGYRLHGWAAKATEPIHWAIYGAGFYGFLKMKAWMFPWAALYVFQVAIAFAVFGLLYADAHPLASIAMGLPFAGLGVMLWMAKDRFHEFKEDQGEAQEKTEEVTDG